VRRAALQKGQVCEPPRSTRCTWANGSDWCIARAYSRKAGLYCSGGAGLFARRLHCRAAPCRTPGLHAASSRAAPMRRGAHVIIALGRRAWLRGRACALQAKKRLVADRHWREIRIAAFSDAEFR